MSSLAELTDYYPQLTGLPVEQDITPSTGQGVPTRITVRPEPRPEPIPEQITRSAIDKLLGIGGERYQLWPEKVVREGLSAAGDVMREGTVIPGLRREDITDIPSPSEPTKDSTWLGKFLGVGPVAAMPGDNLIEKAQAISALAGTGGLAGADATLGSTPFLRPALKYKDKLYKGKEGQQHMDVIPKELYPEFEQMAMSGEDISHYNFGFVNEKGHFLNREKALEHAINNGLVDPVAGQYGVLTSTLMADSSKPGTAIESLAKTLPVQEFIKNSVVKDRLYHGSHSDFSNDFKGRYFSDDPNVSSRFAELGAKTFEDGGAANVTPAYLDIRNPLIIDAAGDYAANFQFGKKGEAFRKAMEGASKYDGVILKNTKDEGNVHIVKNSSQVRGALLADSSKPGTAIEAQNKYTLKPVDHIPEF